ncbi:hypothetical protein M9Y10_041598 [Tritrichomonas musculus]|uniref:Uncharacterized protein n=1 Tax=Tritrichomonas musculus TaxID=1915356 RepID=A0ABR2K5K0_9EUKA
MTLQQKIQHPIKDYFQERKDLFLDSLKKAAAAVVDDEYIKQMFVNNLSKTFIPDRICELVNKNLTDDREKYMTNILEKLNSYEFVFGSERMNQIEEIGFRLNDLFTIPILNEGVYHKQLQKLSLVLSEILKEINTKINKETEKNDNEKNNYIKDISSQVSNTNLNQNQKIVFKSMSAMISNLKQTINDFKNETIDLMKNSNQKLKLAIPKQNTNNNNTDFEKTRQDLLKTIENQSIKIDQLQQQIQSPSHSSLNDSQSKEKLEKRIEKAKIIIQQLSESNEALESNQKVLEEKVEHLKDVNSQLKDQLLLNASQKNALSPSLTQKLNLKNAEDEIYQLKEENSILKEKNEKQKSKFQQRLRTLEIELQQQRESQSQFQSSQLVEKDKIIEDLTNQNKVLVSTIQNNEKKILSKNQRQQKLQEMLQDISNTNEEQKSSIESLSSDNNALMTTVKKIRRDLRIQKQVNDEYSQQIEELKRTFSRAEDQAKDAIELIRDRLSNETSNFHFSTLIEGIRRLFQQIDEKDTRILSLENQKQSLTSTITNKDRENAQIQMTMQQMTEQLKNSSHLRSQYDSQQSIIVESKEAIQQLHDKMEKYKKKAKDLYQSLTDVSIQRDDLLEYKEFSETLKKQNADLQKELKSARQKLAKLELDAQTATSLSQRQYSEQLKDLSRQVREANNRIQRVTTQSSRSIPIESFDDIPRVFADLKQQISKSNSIMTKLKNILQVKNDDDLINEAKNLKQDNNALQEFLKEMTETLNVTSLKKCSKAISELKEEIDSSNQKEQQICQILLIKDPSKIEKKLQNVMETNKIITRVISALHVSDEDQISDKLGELVSMASTLNENGLSSDEKLREHFQQFYLVLNEKKAALEKLKGNENLEESIQKLMAHCKELEKIQFKLKITEQEPQRVDLLLNYEKDMIEICSILQLHDFSEVVQNISELVTANNDLIEEEERIMSALAVLTPDSIIPKIDDLSKQITDKTAFIDNICEKLRVRDSNQLIEKIGQLVAMKTEYKTAKKLLMSDNLTESVRHTRDNFNDLQSFISEICQILKVTDVNQIKKTLQLLLKENEDFHAIDVMFPIQFSGNVKERVSKILKMVKETKEFNEKLCQQLRITKIEDIEKTVSGLIESQQMASELFTEMLKSMLSAEIEINFPITTDEKTRLLNIFHENRKRNEDTKLQIDLILNKAMSFGYRGNSCTEAVDTIVATFSERDKQSLTSKMHEELMSVRAASENDKKAAERQKDKYKKTINKLKQQITELQDEKTQKETELVQQLNIEREKSQELASDLGNQQRIQNELISVLNGQIHDEQFLMSNLSKRDSSIVQEAGKKMKSLSFLSQSTNPSKTVQFK